MQSHVLRDHGFRVDRVRLCTAQPVNCTPPLTPHSEAISSCGRQWNSLCIFMFRITAAVTTRTCPSSPPDAKYCVSLPLMNSLWYVNKKSPHRITEVTKNVLNSPPRYDLYHPVSQAYPANAAITPPSFACCSRSLIQIDCCSEGLLMAKVLSVAGAGKFYASHVNVRLIHSTLQQLLTGEI